MRCSLLRAYTRKERGTAVSSESVNQQPAPEPRPALVGAKAVGPWPGRALAPGTVTPGPSAGRGIPGDPSRPGPGPGGPGGRVGLAAACWHRPPPSWAASAGEQRRGAWHGPRWLPLRPTIPRSLAVASTGHWPLARHSASVALARPATELYRPGRSPPDAGVLPRRALEDRMPHGPVMTSARI
jgi:hypothetical protein